MMKEFIHFVIAFSLLLLVGCNSKNISTSENSSTIYTETIENKGSDTMVNLALAWAEKYQTLHPEVRISVTGGGSGNGIASLINGTVDLANASREIKIEEIYAVQESGVDPMEYIVARDAIAVIVNPQNPINKLTLRQISSIYSGEINNWSDLGGENRPIVRLSRETNSGTHVYFLENVLRLGDHKNTTLFSSDTLLLPSSEGISAEIRQNPNAIGYDGLGYVTEEMKVIAVSSSYQGDYVYPSVESVNDGSYPIARDLYIYTAGIPVGEVKTYLDWILSPLAQEIVTELGFVPIIQ